MITTVATRQALSALCGPLAELGNPKLQEFTFDEVFGQHRCLSKRFAGFRESLESLQTVTSCCRQIRISAQLWIGAQLVDCGQAGQRSECEADGNGTVQRHDRRRPRLKKQVIQ